MAASITTPLAKSHTLYFHKQEETKWNMASFTECGRSATIADFLKLTEALKIDTLSDGMFFFFRDPIPPLWENCNNIYGGCYSFKVVKRDAGKAFSDYAIALMLNRITSDPANTINGISISPKKTHNIIKVWNSDSKTFSSPADLLKLIPDLKMEEIIYTPFTDKKM